MTMVIRDRPLVSYVGDLVARQPFALSRWGDGEWMALLGQSGSTCDGQRYSGALRAALTEVLMARPTYELAIGPFALRRFGQEIEVWLSRRRLRFAWTSANVFAYASRDNRLDPLVAALAARAVVLVGPAYLSALTLFPILAQVVVPEHEAFDDLARLDEETVQLVTIFRAQQPVVALSAGPVANILVHRLRAACPEATLIDFGSVWDPYVGRLTRTYQRAVLARAQRPS